MKTDFLAEAHAMALKLGYEAGRMMTAQFFSEMHVRKKGEIDLVTDTDIAINTLLTNELKKAFPAHGIWAEEDTSPKNLKNFSERYLWLIDPIDGTTNYAHRVPHAAVSIALYDQESAQVLLGIVYEPFHDECFSAQIGQGATLNRKPIFVSEIGKLKEALLATGYSYDRGQTEDNNMAETSHLLFAAQDLRRFGAASLDLAWVSAGRLDGYWERCLKPWDYAAGMLIVTEAGGTISCYDGSPMAIESGHILASNSLLHKDLQKAVSEARAKAHLPLLP